MPRIAHLDELRMENGLMPSFAWPGGYPLYYIVADCGCLCPQCVNENLGLLQDPDDKQWHVISYEVNYEDDSLQCDHCYKLIESAYSH
jgi:hypothetical protein